MNRKEITTSEKQAYLNDIKSAISILENKNHQYSRERLSEAYEHVAEGFSVNDKYLIHENLQLCAKTLTQMGYKEFSEEIMDISAQVTVKEAEKDVERQKEYLEDAEMLRSIGCIYASECLRAAGSLSRENPISFWDTAHMAYMQKKQKPFAAFSPSVQETVRNNYSILTNEKAADVLS